MNICKRRVISGALVILCLFIGLSTPARLPGLDAAVLAAATPAPDLAIESVALSPATPSIGDTLTFTVTVKNRGDITAGPSQLASIIDEHHLAASTVEPVNPGAVVIKTFTWKAQAGPHIFQAVIDSAGSVTESDETNNDISYAFSVLAPDLAIDAISWTPVIPAAGDKVVFTVTIINLGDKRATSSHIDFLIDGFSRGYRSILGIESGASVNETFTWTAMTGLHNIRAVADVLQQVAESDENNNVTEATCAIALPDLTISSIIISPENPSVGTNVTLTVSVKNQGSGKAWPSSLFYYVDDILEDLQVLGFLNQGETTTANFTWIARSDPHTFKLVADATDLVVESDENNNTLIYPAPQLLPDLIIQAITCTPANPELYSIVSTTITVKNQGTCAADFTQLKFGIDTIYQFTSMIPELSVNSTTTVTFMWKTLYLSHTLKAYIDEGNSVKESNESNNTLTKTITSIRTTPSADLILEKITCSPAKPVIGETVTITLQVKNQGTGKATPSHAAIYLDSNLMDSVYIDALEAGATLTKNVTLSLKGLPFKDSYKVRVRLDPDNSVFESDELNNVKETSFSIYAPDLAIQVIRWTPEAPAVGDRVTFDVTVKNHGDLKSGSTYVSYYIDKAFMGRHGIEEIEAGTTVTRSFTWTAQSGSFNFTAIIDEAGEINESDESNNTRTVDLPAPDLFIKSITWSPENPSEFSPVTFTVAIGNRGYSRSTGTLLWYYIDGAAPLSVNTGEISPGGTASVVFTYAYQSGEHAIKFVTDGNDAISESDETNNEKTIMFPVQPLTANAATPESANKTASKPPEPASTVTLKTSDNLTSQNNTPGQTPVQDITANITAAPPKWQGILQNRWLITGTAALGIGAIGVLLLFRKRAKKRQLYRK